jgi:hypothetical protein
MVVGHWENFHGLGVQDFTEIKMLLIFFLKERKREKWPRAFFSSPRADMPCWLCHAKILLAVKCN